MTVENTIYTIYLTVSITYSIYLYVKYGTEKVDELVKKVFIAMAIIILIFGIFCRNGDERELPIWVMIVVSAIFAFGSIGFNKGHPPRLEQNEAPIKYFLLQLFFIAGIGVCTVSLTLGVISFILAGDVDASFKGNW